MRHPDPDPNPVDQSRTVRSEVLVALLKELDDTEVLWRMLADPDTDWPRRPRHHEPLLDALQKLVHIWREANVAPPPAADARGQEREIPW